MKTELQLALVGGDVERSPSAAMHQAALRAIGRRGVYRLVSVDAAALPQCLEALRSDGVSGVNVTIPHKQAVIAHTRRLDPGAAAAGAVNTLCAESGGWAGHNTDATGLARLLAPHPLDGATAVLLGAGGMARAALLALRSRCRLVVVVNRDARRAQRMVDELGATAAPNVRAAVGVSVIAAADAEEVATALAEATVLVNATSVGMHDPAASPLPATVALGGVRLVCDAVHTPRDTALLRRAAAEGATVLDGLELLAAQAADSFALWTGERVPDAVFRAAATPASAA